MSRDNTVEIASQIQNSYAIPALAHLTCAGNSVEDVEPILRTLRENGVKNIRAQGDLAEGEALKDFRYASDLIKHIRSRYDFRISRHATQKSTSRHILWKMTCAALRKRLTAGGCAHIAALDNELFYRFRDRARAMGIAAL